MSEKAKLRAGENSPCYGRKLTEEQKRKISESVKGFKHSEETKAKMRGLHSGEKHHACRAIICVTNGEYFEYIKKAADKYNIQRSNIIKCCKGERKTAGGLAWRYANEC